MKMVSIEEFLTRCCCGPYSRESGYYPSREFAEKDLKTGTFGRV